VSEVKAEAKTGVAVLAHRDGRFLLGVRKGAHGAGDWGPPGGKPEPGEDLIAGGLRELYEETGLEGLHPRLVAETRDDFPEGVVFDTHYLLVEVAGEPEAREPEKCDAWEWFSWTGFPEPLFLPLRNLHAQGFDPLPASRR
jgi:8-oxo-dGTP diphosphatase